MAKEAFFLKRIQEATSTKWNEDKSAIMDKITQHIDFFVNILKK